MATIKVKVPEGKYCSDKCRIGCMFDKPISGIHTCDIFGCILSKVEIRDKEGCRHRVLLKCPDCYSEMQADNSDNRLEPRDQTEGWKFP